METLTEVNGSVNLKQSIKFGEKFSYGLGDAACNVVWASVTAFLTFFYTDVAGIAAAIIGTVMLVARILDAFVDLGIGITIDRTRSKYGKARPWLLWMAIPYGVMAVLLFSVPDFGPTGKVVYVIITYLLINIIYSAVNVPYGTLNSLITQDQYQRSILNIFRMIMAIVASIVVGVATMPLVKKFGGGPHGWRITFILFGTVATIFLLITFFFTKERVKAANSGEEQKTVPVKVALKALKANKYWQIIAVVSIVGYINSGIAGINVYYAQYILGNANYVGLLTIASMVPMILGMLLMAPIIKRYGKRNTALIGFAINILGSLILITNPYNATIVIASVIIKGLGSAPLAGTLFAMVADTIEYGEWKSGVRTEGMIYSAASFGVKVGSGLGAAMLGWILAWGGYVSGAAVQSSSALFSIQALFIYIPLLLMLVTVALLWFYKLDREYPKIIEELHQRSK